MAFYRVKKIKGKPYLYIVNNKWTKKGPRQKVSKYIGRVYSFTKSLDKSFKDYIGKETSIYLYENSKEEIISDLIRWELYKHRVRGINIDIKKRSITRNGRKVAIRINEGFLCDESLTSLIDFVPEGNKNDGFRLAKAFVDAGIAVPKDVFVETFKKVCGENIKA